jgi:hypothetical protein
MLPSSTLRRHVVWIVAAPPINRWSPLSSPEKVEHKGKQRGRGGFLGLAGLARPFIRWRASHSQRSQSPSATSSIPIWLSISGFHLDRDFKVHGAINMDFDVGA